MLYETTDDAYMAGVTEHMDYTRQIIAAMFRKCNSMTEAKAFMTEEGFLGEDCI